MERKQTDVTFEITCTTFVISFLNMRHSDLLTNENVDNTVRYWISWIHKL